jgi:hypothetical protein
MQASFDIYLKIFWDVFAFWVFLLETSKISEDEFTPG